jgi:hypothetical protein
VHIKAKDTTFQCPRLVVEVGSSSQFDEIDSIPPALGDIGLLVFRATAKFGEGSVPMVVKVGVVRRLSYPEESVYRPL